MPKYRYNPKNILKKPVRFPEMNRFSIYVIIITYTELAPVCSYASSYIIIYIIIYIMGEYCRYLNGVIGVIYRGTDG